MRHIMRIQYIVTHPGMAHRDDFLACCLALTKHATTSIYRRDPTEAELNDKNVLVLDVGMRHEPELNNFDHHQLKRDAPAECALSMYVEELGYTRSFELQEWYETTKTLDAKGPFVTARELGLPVFPFELASPTEGVMLQWFGEFTDTPVESKLISLMKEMGVRLLNNIQSFGEEYIQAHNNLNEIVFSDIQALIWETKHPSKAMTLLQREFHPNAAISICPDDRGPGWILYRYNDHPRVDFSILDGHEDIVFAHVGGFIAKTKAMDIKQAIDLAKLGVK
jgi:hypothetical protein